MRRLAKLAALYLLPQSPPASSEGSHDTVNLQKSINRGRHYEAQAR